VKGALYLPAKSIAGSGACLKAIAPESFFEASTFAADVLRAGISIRIAD
jgi:hypothetical protein